MTTTKPSTSTFYGTESETYYVDSAGGIWLVQGPDMRIGQRREQIDALPEECLVGQTHLPPELLDEGHHEVAAEIEAEIAEEEAAQEPWEVS